FCNQTKIMTPKNTNPTQPAEDQMPIANTGNASNPSPHNDIAAPAPNQLLPKEAEEYLRESGNIEDLPDAEDAAEMEKEM
ncbi:MAG: hypothetical protein V4676_06120, partial [Bacteroidota bacterium]